MTDKQPEALRLAYKLNLMFGWNTCAEAAAELRRLHEVNVELVEALRWCASSLNTNNERTAFVFAALAKAEGK